MAGQLLRFQFGFDCLSVVNSDGFEVHIRHSAYDKRKIYFHLC